MKFRQFNNEIIEMLSPPAREVWIEISSVPQVRLKSASPPAREVWIEIWDLSGFFPDLLSPPAREVWIEIHCRSLLVCIRNVTSREGGVD